MRIVRPASLVASLLLVLPAIQEEASAHGGAYRPPAGEVPPDTRPPSDPPPPPDSGGPGTPGGGEPGGPTTGPGGGIGGPTTEGGGGGGNPGSSPGGGPPPTGGPGPGPTTPSGGRRSGRGASTPEWIYWWNYNKDELIQQRSVRRLREPGRTGSIVHYGGSRAAGSARITATQAAVQTVVLPLLRELAVDPDQPVDVRGAAAIGLAKAGDEASVISLLRLAADEENRRDAELQEAATLALGLLGARTPEVRSALAGLLADREPPRFVRPFAAVSLGLLGPSGDPQRTASEALFATLGARDPGVDLRPAALLGLGLLGDEADLPALLDLLERGRPALRNAPELTETELAFAVEAIGRIGAPGLPGADRETAVLDTMTALVESRRDVPASVRRSAVIALGRLAPAAGEDAQARTVTLLVRTYRGSRSAPERYFALVALGRIGGTRGASDAVREACTDTLRDALDRGQPDATIRPFAALGLALVGRALAAEGRPVEEAVRLPIRRHFAEEKNPSVRGAYALASGLMRDPLAVPAIARVLADGGEPRLRAHCALALGMIGDDGAREVVRQALEENDRDLRVHAALAAGLLADSGAVARLVEVLRDGESSQYVLGSAALALGQIGDDQAVEALCAIVRDDRGYPSLTRSLAVVALGEIADREDVPVLGRVARDVNYLAPFPALLELLSIF